jgi:hypothetical protein
MSRRRAPRKPASTKAPDDGTKLGHLSDAELFAELARRRMPQGETDLEAIEEMVERTGHQAEEVLLAATIAALPPEDGKSKPCPKCGKPVPVKTRNRVRHLMTVGGELRLSRNYHHCRACKHGFYPRDIELKLPEEGELSNAMERRVLDFGVNDTFQSAAERWSIHYPTTISENLVRRVVERAGHLCESASSPKQLQEACRPAPEEAPTSLVVGGDGSMVLTREDAWRETKLAVVARGETFVREKGRTRVAEARYVAVLGGQEEFKTELKAALDAERADEVMNVVWLGDGAPGNWTVAKELCPFAIQVLDFQHAMENGMDCAKVLFGEGSECLSIWERSLRHLLHQSPEAVLRELMDCVPETTRDEQLDALDQLVGYYRANDRRMRYREFREQGLPIGSGIIESAHRHVLQVRMKRAGQRWALKRARRMVRLRAAYRTAGAHRFHWALREAQRAPEARPHHPVTQRHWRDRHLFRASM